jgi:hypothetical protein
VARPDGGKVARGRGVGLEAARRFKEILRGAAAPPRPLPPLSPPPSLEERRPLKFLRRPEPDDGQDE